jgi:hypothetical protein
MPSLCKSLSLRSSAVRGAGGGIDFSGLPNLPTDQRNRVETSAGDQAILDSLAKLDVWIDPYAPIFTDAAGTTAATIGDPVGNVQCYVTGNSYTQSNAANQPTLSAGPSMTGGNTKTLSGTPGTTGVKQLIVATTEGVFEAEVDLISPYTLRNVPGLIGWFAGDLSAADITNIKAYGVAEGAGDLSGSTDWQTYFNNTRITSWNTAIPSSVTNLSGAWANNNLLTTFPSNIFDSCTCINYNGAFSSTNLTQASIDNILASINTSAQANSLDYGTFGQSGGSAPSATGEAAIDALRARGWVVTVTGGY